MKYLSTISTIIKSPITFLATFQNHLNELLIIKKSRNKQKTALEDIKRKKTIKVVFFVIHSSIWKYDELYQIMSKTQLFKPIIVICPYIRQDESNMFSDMNEAYNYFSQKGYNVLQSYNYEEKKWIDIKVKINPDIVFFTNPHNITREEYYIYNWIDVLTCYVQYSFHVSYLNNLQYNQLFHNIVWLSFCETTIHLEFAKKISKNKGRNVLYTGYPGTDIFLSNGYIPKDKWKIQTKNVKRIIWAPHHTIFDNDSYLGYSNFLDFAFKVLDLLKSNDSIQIAFKPHPILKAKLYEHHDWGKYKTDSYYTHWENLANGFLVNDEYADLFLTSDAIIHDSGSFLVEYLYVNRPSLFCFSNSSVIDKFNDFGKMALKVHYHAHSFEHVVTFINEVLSPNGDYKKQEREKFVSQYLIPPNNLSASLNIFNCLISKIR